jgi:hypothetical protein
MKILILTAGKTGSTALTYGIHAQLPNHEIIFEPQSLKTVDYNEKNIIVKSLKIINWESDQEEFFKFDKRILLVRHPFDRIISYLLYIPYNGQGFSNDHIARQYLDLVRNKAENPRDIDTLEIIHLLQDIFSLKLLMWLSREHNNMLELFNKNSVIPFELVKYEDFMQGINESLEGYLGVVLPTGSNVEVADNFKRVSRQRKYGEWHAWFTQNDINEISPLFAGFNQRFKYKSDKNMTGEIPFIEPEYSYLYTMKVINEYRQRQSLPLYEDGKIKIGEEGIFIDQAIRNFQNKNYIEAENSINRALEINPDLPEISCLKAKISRSSL